MHVNEWPIPFGKKTEYRSQKSTAWTSMPTCTKTWYTQSATASGSSLTSFVSISLIQTLLIFALKSITKLMKSNQFLYSLMSGAWTKLPGSMRQMIRNVTSNGRTLMTSAGTNYWAKTNSSFATTLILEFMTPLPFSSPSHPTYRRLTRWTWNATRAWGLVRWWRCRKTESLPTPSSWLSLVGLLQPLRLPWRLLIRALTSLAFWQVLQFLFLPWQSHSMPLKNARKVQATLMITLSLSFELF